MLHCRDLLDLAALLSSLHARAGSRVLNASARGTRVRKCHHQFGILIAARARGPPHVLMPPPADTIYAQSRPARLRAQLYSCRLGAPQLLPARCSFRS